MGSVRVTGYDREFPRSELSIPQITATRRETVAEMGGSDRGPRACHCRFAKLPQRRLDVLESSHDYPDPMTLERSRTSSAISKTSPLRSGSKDFSLFKVQAVESEKAIVITDTDGTIRYVNPAFERVNGYTSDEAIGRTPVPLKSSQQDDIFYARLWRRSPLASGKKLVNKTKYGELYEAKHTIIPVTDKNGTITHFAGIAATSPRRCSRCRRLVS